MIITTDLINGNTDSIRYKPKQSFFYNLSATPNSLMAIQNNNNQRELKKTMAIQGIEQIGNNVHRKFLNRKFDQ